MDVSGRSGEPKLKGRARKGENKRVRTEAETQETKQRLLNQTDGLDRVNGRVLSPLGPLVVQRPG